MKKVKKEVSFKDTCNLTLIIDFEKLINIYEIDKAMSMLPHIIDVISEIFEGFDKNLCIPCKNLDTALLQALNISDNVERENVNRKHKIYIHSIIISKNELNLPYCLPKMIGFSRIPIFCTIDLWDSNPKLHIDYHTFKTDTVIGEGYIIKQDDNRQTVVIEKNGITNIGGYLYILIVNTNDKSLFGESKLTVAIDGYIVSVWENIEDAFIKSDQLKQHKCVIMFSTNITVMKKNKFLDSTLLIANDLLKSLDIPGIVLDYECYTQLDTNSRIPFKERNVGSKRIFIIEYHDRSQSLLYLEPVIDSNYDELSKLGNIVAELRRDVDKLKKWKKNTETHDNQENMFNMIEPSTESSKTSSSLINLI